jgi:hypothetical protein
MHLSSPHTSYMLRPCHSLVRSTDHKAPQYRVFSTPLRNNAKEIKNYRTWETKKRAKDFDFKIPMKKTKVNCNNYFMTGHCIIILRHRTTARKIRKVE